MADKPAGLNTLNLDANLISIRGVGVRTTEILAKEGIKTVYDLIEYYPYRYEDFSLIKKISELKSGESVTVRAWVSSISMRRSLKNRRLTIVQGVLSDEAGSIEAIWFNQPYLINTLSKGQTYFFSGSVSSHGKLQLQNPRFETPESGKLSVGRLVPVYSLPNTIAPKRYRIIVYELLNQIPKNYDYLPNSVKKEVGIWDLPSAWKNIHFPESSKKLEAAKKRLAFDELFLLQLQILHRREQLRKSNAPVITFDQAAVKKFVGSLPFKLTLSQKTAAWDIIQDLTKPRPMNRLLQGDVGSGKTVVAAIAAESVARCGLQAAVLAPTEILAQQHYSTLTKLLLPQEVTVALLTGGTPKKERPKIYEAAASGRIKVLVGTHALLNENIVFNNLGLIVVDEQHRFGVKQRSTLRQAQGGKQMPHLLSMTATPIPRTLALTLYGDLAISSITELPPGRQEISTEIIRHSERQKAYALLRRQVLSGHQGFIIYPLLEESETLSAKAAKVEYERLSKTVFPNFSLGLIHGKLKSQEKDRIMSEFKDAKYHILVSTSVIEVGIDVPNATVAIIEGAERFGLAQLHQFRGRIGRGEHTSYCVLVPSDEQIPERLQAICKYNDGFKLAELDLKYRGMGEITGLKQSGFLDMKIADPADLNTVKLARTQAEKIIRGGLSNYPELSKLLRKKEGVMHPE